jgi:hypothetical protein
MESQRLTLVTRWRISRRVLAAATVTGILLALVAWIGLGSRPRGPTIVVCDDRVTAGPFAEGTEVRIVCVDPDRGDAPIDAQAGLVGQVELILRPTDKGRMLVCGLPFWSLSVPVRSGARFAEAYIGTAPDGAKCVLAVLKSCDP